MPDKVANVPSPGDPDSESSLSSEMQTLTTVIRDLEDQLDRLMAINEATKSDLEEERKRRIGLQSRLDEQQEGLRRAEQELTETEKLRTEVGHLHHERTRLATSVRELTTRLEAAEEEQQRHARLIDRLRIARTDALEEVESVESQFERAMQLVTHLRAQFTVATEERDALTARLKANEQTGRLIRDERDALVTEVEQSRASLDEIRRSLVDSFGVPPTDTNSRPPKSDLPREAR